MTGNTWDIIKIQTKTNQPTMGNRKDHTRVRGQRQRKTKSDIKTSKYRESDKSRLNLFSNSSRGTLMSYTDHSVQRRFKSNAPTDWISQHCLVIT